MARLAFYDDNRGRDYPLLKGTSFVPFSALVACGFLLGPNTGFVVGTHSVKLVRVSRHDGYFWFYFECDAPGLADKHIVFSRAEAATEYELEYADSAGRADTSLSSLSASLSSSASVSANETSESFDTTNECDFADDFTGFLITGTLDDLAGLLADGDTLTGDAAVEPALLQSVVNTYARSLNLANADRTRYQAPEGCDEPDWPVPPQPLYVRQTCLQGKQVFVPGYNLSVLQNDFDNSLTFSAATSAGDGEPCQQVPVYAGEVPPDDSLFLEGGPSCSELVRSVGGVSGPIVPVAGGSGVSVSYRPAENKLTINVDLHSMAVCAADLFTADAELAACNLQGTAEHTLAAMTLAGVGAVSVHGSGVLTLAAMQPFSQGFNTVPPSGTGAPSLGAMLAAGNGLAIDQTGTGAPSLPPMSCSGSGKVSNRFGSGALITRPMTMIGAGGNGGMLAYVGRVTTLTLPAPEASYLVYLNTLRCRALPGQNGDATSNPGQGGQASNPQSVGDTKYSGGDGFLVVYPATFGGGGGSSASRLGNGGTATGTGGVAATTSPQGAGADGQVSPTHSTSPGGGGGGGYDYWDFFHVNHFTGFPTDGGAGRIIITFNDIANTVTTLSSTGYFAVTIPSGATTAVVECWGAGGRGGNGNLSQWGGGGGGGYSKTTITL